MAIVRYRPSMDVLGPIFEDLFAPLPWGSLLRAPEAEVVETEAGFRVMLEMPGTRAEDIDIGLEDNVLTISGEKRQEWSEGEEQGRWHLSERRYGRFSRSFVLPRDVDAERIEARFEDGVLHVSIPKSERARRRRIEIQRGGARNGSEAGAEE